MKSCHHAKILMLSCLLLLAGHEASAQFHTNGDDPGRIRWSKMDSPHYRFIYPSGMDSLAVEYGTQMERFRMAESISSGLVPGEGYRRRTPVIIHAYHGIANGSITWAPKRADLYTLPDAYDPEPMPWIKSLAVHESRHLAQMQFGYKGWLHPLTYIIGDMAGGAYSALWPSTWFLEGDAVTAETALTRYGRGRSADFLDYYMMAFDNGDWRNWYRWRYGSYGDYAPNHYALGYMTIAGTRYCFDDPSFTERYLARPAHNPFSFFNTQRTVREASGKSFRESFDTLMTTFHSIWKQEQEARRPFTESRIVQDKGRWFTTMSGNVTYGGRVYGISSGIAESESLVCYDPHTGRTSRLRPFGSTTSGLKAGAGKLWWSESIPDSRWSLRMSSRIRSYDIRTGRVRNLTTRGRLFNPDISPDGSMLAAVEYPAEGGSAIVIVNAEDGSIIRRRQMPDSLQAVEVCLMDDRLAFSTVSEAGSGIHFISIDLDGEIGCLSEPLPVSISELGHSGSRLYFTSDRDGTQEMYSIEPGTGVFRQHTSLRYGGKEFSFSGDTLYFSSLVPSGRLLNEALSGALTDKRVDFRDIHHYKVADCLSEQEKALAASKGISWADSDTSFRTAMSRPLRYRKALNILRFHSWAPLYFNYDKVRSLSGDLNYETASAGATALFQNSLGTAWGSIGYSFHNDPYSYLYNDGSHKYRHSGHILFTYSGLYPVFEISADFNDNAAVQYYRQEVTFNGTVQNQVLGLLRDTPSLNGNFKVYIPFNFSSGGWSRGLIPQVSYNICNDLFDKTLTRISYDGNFSGKKGPAHFTGLEEGKNVFMQTLNASVRGYIMRPVASSGTYPRLGAGMEAGYSTRVLLDDLYSSSAYIYMYGYLPGVTLTQGLRLSARYQHQFEASVKRENAISVAPRGFDSYGAESFIRNHSSDHLKITADYAIPIRTGDISFLSPVAYIKNLELTPHLDYTMFTSGRGSSIANGGLLSAGASIVAKLANLLWIPYDCSIGISAGYNGGPSYSHIKNAGYRMEHHYVQFVFNLSL